MLNRNVVIVGGGFGGTTLARALDAHLPAGHELILISEESYMTFNPMLPEAVGASIFPEQVVAPIRQMLRRGRFIMGRVQGIDMQARTVACDTLRGRLVLDYAELVLAFGNRARLDLIPGADAHALPLKTVGDAIAIRNQVLRRIARLELESDPDLRRRLGHFVVIGGGFSGVEVAGELIDCLRTIRRYYALVRPDELRVTVVQDIERLLPELPDRLGAAARLSLERRGGVVRTGLKAVAIDATGVRFAGGERLDSATVICTIGTRANPLAACLGLPAERGRIVVAPDMSVPSAPGVWALGDCALVPNARDGGFSPPTAQFAVRQAQVLARNIGAHLAGQPTRRFDHASRGMMAAIGHTRGVAQVAGLRFSGLAAWLLWRAYYLAQMPTLGRKVRIFVEWTWGMFFPADITHLRFTRSADADTPANSDVMS